MESEHQSWRGQIKQECEDFVVEEIPSYQPSGGGDHLYLWVEKRDASAKYALRAIAKYCDIRERDIGSAGNKDRRAVTRQFYSVPRSIELAEHVVPFDINEQVRVLSVTPHTNKLRRGHLQGNRFEVVVRRGDFSWPEQVGEELARRVERLKTRGMLNLYGEQRFGRDGDTVKLGLGLLKGEGWAKKRVSRDRFLKRLSLNAVQSVVFNRTLRARLERDGGEWIVRRGDVLERVETGGRFVCEDPEVDQQRVDQGELVLTGPMHGPKMRQTQDEAHEFEQSIMTEYDLDVESFQAFSKLCPGSRRALKVSVADLETQVYSEDHVKLGFSLPSGSYATILLSQIFDEVV